MTNFKSSVDAAAARMLASALATADNECRGNARTRWAILALMVEIHRRSATLIQAEVDKLT